jgi:hypothetical protein
MCTVNVLLACVVPVGTVTPFAPPHCSTPAAIAQLPPQPLPCEAIVQDRPGFVGNVSRNFTPWSLERGTVVGVRAADLFGCKRPPRT